MNVDIERFIEEYNELSKIGRKDDGGITRLAFSDVDFEFRERFKEICNELDLDVNEDGAGNIWARKNGIDETSEHIIIGSHIDTVQSGGAYDGTLGVMSGLEVIRMLKENNVCHKHSIDVVVFSVEESSRYDISTVGSKLITGKVSPKVLKNYCDAAGKSLYNELIRNNFDPNDLVDSMKRVETAKCFFELHIEQGPILEANMCSIGIVEGIAAPIRLKVNILGSDAHSGACPMAMRKDALTVASQIILDVETIANRESQHKTVATIGKCVVLNGAMNKVPGEVELYIDIRGIDRGSMMTSLGKIRLDIDTVCKLKDLDYKIAVLCDEYPVTLNSKLNELVEESCKRLELKYMKIVSGAGHDTMNIVDKTDATLIFIPCKNGVSHNKNEDVKKLDIENGIKLLYDVIYQVSNE